MATPSFPPCVLFYVDAKYPIDDAVKWEYIERKDVDLQTLYTSVFEILQKYVTDKDSGATMNAEDYRWNLFEQLGIPEGSEFYYATELRAPPEKAYKAPNGTIGFTEGFRLVFNALSPYVAKHICNFDPSTYHGSFTFLKDGPNGQVFWRMSNLTETFYHSYRLVGSGSKEEQKKYYKLHITPKHEYSFYVICRCISIMKDMLKEEKSLSDRFLQAKLIFEFRANKPTEKNTSLLRQNGGAAPCIVIYLNEDVGLAKRVLEQLLKEFTSDIEKIGTMTPEYAYRVLPFNVRLNSLVSYAQGDRMAKLSARNSCGQKYWYQPYLMPKWVKEMMNGTCNESLSMQLLGKNICSAETKAILDYEKCHDDICWMTAFPDEFLDPRTLTNFKEEGIPATSLKEADTTTNNATPCSAIGAGAGASAATQQGGKRTQKTRRKRVKKQKRKTKVSKKKRL